MASHGTKAANLFCRSLGWRRFTFRTEPYAQETNGLAFYLPIIRKHLEINYKVLHFNEGSKLPGYLAQLGPEDLHQDPAEFPPLAALGYEVTYFASNKPAPQRERGEIPQSLGGMMIKLVDKFIN
jgi:hypothetical protein